MSFALPALPYAYDSLQPYLSAETLEFHHDKHHAAYVSTANNLLKDSGLDGKSLEHVVKETYGKNVALFNNAAQHYNHSEYWKSIKPSGGGNVPGALNKALIESFGSVETAKQELVQAGTTQFGSGWAWLAVKDGKLVITKTGNAENPLIQGATPILTIDVWEHTYYIDYRNRRADYLKAFVDNLVNWDYVAERYEAAVK
ncbi:MAG: superoxide dismutase [Beijerinckiaceae bacterium]|nr:superoxide dismutase [Beijerinckiaceae bacterium]